MSLAYLDQVLFYQHNTTSLLFSGVLQSVQLALMFCAYMMFTDLHPHLLDELDNTATFTKCCIKLDVHHDPSV